MACEQVIVTLTPVYSPDTLPFRSLAFSSNNETIPIGRASKSETKNLVPGHDNGWFDSRVMSRDHAVISVSMEKKAVYIRDHGSLHGTQLNDVTITPKQNVTVKSGDVLTFGNEISRGTQTFRPVAVRLDCEWHEKPIAPSPTKPTVNTFRVPDEEDDIVEVVSYKEVAQQNAMQWASDSSDVDYGSDMSRPLDLTSPITSPEIKTSQLPKQQAFEAGNAASVQQTSVTTSEAANPPSSPPAQSEDEDQSGSEAEEDDGSDSDDSAGEDTRKVFDDESEASDDGHYEGSDWDEQEADLAGVQAPPFPSFQGSMAPPFAGLNAGSGEVKPSTRDEIQPIPPMPTLEEVNNMLFQTKESASAVPEQSRISTAFPQQGFTFPEYSFPRIPTPPRIPSPSDKAMAKPLGIPAAPAPAPVYHPCSNFSRGLAAPKHGLLKPTLHNTGGLGSSNANESFPFGPHRSSGYLRNFNKVPDDGRPSWLHDTISSRRSSIENPEPLKKAEKLPTAPKTRVPASGMVGAYTQDTTAAIMNLKRKVDEYLADLNQTPKEIGNTQDSIADAQPRPNMQALELTQSQGTDTQSLQEVAQTSPKKNPRKRVKTHQAYTFMKYAAIAAVGAAVGSIGTIAGLSSLPADYFS
ncbi:FHA domain protein [Talaromyces stipitatus ATCC 10500]|uniref:FHA domain protein n=1 Tax=Talaromyces stipitatus (strain ATCC 10500 / CBS 375.48 / QM 6759 / NRRL 1006) TaxID=441959 RepID=B8MS35_TALSN|nr:FHA domain protein [Talaromyces stipitatus ATCC 10500]EED12213.1 FHA domain protein [Talaromyces stipitatus ATCC 10500]